MKAHHQYKNISRQQGMAMIISMLILLVLTLVGVSSMNNTILEEKMSGNVRDYNIAFQAAESALAEGEDTIGSAALPAFTGTDGLYPATSDGIERWQTVNWSSDEETRLFTSSLQKVNQQPRYILEELQSVPAEGSSVVVGFVPTPQVEYFRVTAQGVGASSKTEVYLQTTYRR